MRSGTGQREAAASHVSWGQSQVRSEVGKKIRSFRIQFSSRAPGTRQAALGALDALTTRFWAFTRLVLGSFNRFALAQSASLKRLLQDNLRFVVLQSVARHRRFYSPAFVCMLEETSPVRFCYLARQEKSLTDRYAEALRPYGKGTGWNLCSTCWTDVKRET